MIEALKQIFESQQKLGSVFEKNVAAMDKISEAINAMVNQITAAPVISSTTPTQKAQSASIIPSTGIDLSQEVLGGGLETDEEDSIYLDEDNTNIDGSLNINEFILKRMNGNGVDPDNQGEGWSWAK